MPIIPLLGKLRQEGHKFILGYIVKHSVKNETKQRLLGESMRAFPETMDFKGKTCPKCGTIQRGWDKEQKDVSWDRHTLSSPPPATMRAAFLCHALPYHG
jgi:hypothetical protein